MVAGRPNSSPLSGAFVWTLGALAFTIPLEGIIASYAGSTTRTIPFYIAALAALLALPYLPVLARRLSKSGGFPLLILAFCWSSLLYYLKPLWQNQEVIMLAQLVAMGVMFLYVGPDPVWRRRLLWVLWAGWCVLCVLSLLDYTTGRLATWQYGGGLVRARELVGLSTNQHAYVVGAGLIMSFSMLQEGTKLRARLGLIGGIAVGCLAFMMGVSKGASLALIPPVILWLLFVPARPLHLAGRGRAGRLGLAIAAVVCVMAVTTQLELGRRLFGYTAARFQTMTSHSQGALSQRDVLVAEGLRLAGQDLVGVGQGNSVGLMGGGDVHNYYLRMLIDGGVLGFMLLLIGIFLIVRRGWRWYRESGEGAYFLPLVYLVVASFAGRALQYKIGWFFLAMNAAVPHVLSTRSVARRPGTTGADR